MIEIKKQIAAKALMFVKSQKPQNILDSLVILMMALEDSNYHTELAKLQKASGVKINQFYGSKWDKAGVKLSQMVGWDGISAAWVMVASQETIEDKKGLLALLRKSGIDITTIKQASKKSAKTPITSKAEKDIKKSLSPINDAIESMISTLSKRYEKYETDPRVKEDEEGLGAEMGYIDSDYMFLVSDAQKDLKKSVDNVLKVIEDIFESAEKLEQGLDRMDQMK